MAVVLHHELVAGDAPTRWMLLTHGIYGSGANWRGIARKLTARRPEWGIALVDLRQHGRSPAGAPPHTLAACAEDILAKARALGATVIAGHSFGGKVCLVARGLARPADALAQTWVLDSSPSPRPDAASDLTNDVGRVLALLQRLPRRWARREDFVAAVMADGHALGFAQWLAMSVVPLEDGTGELALRFELDAMGDLLADYYARDAWPELLAPAPGTVELVIAERSTAVSAADRARLAALPPGPSPRVHVVAAGHWLHVDAPAAVIGLFAAHLPAA